MSSISQYYYVPCNLLLLYERVAQAICLATSIQRLSTPEVDLELALAALKDAAKEACRGVGETRQSASHSTNFPNWDGIIVG